MKKRTITRIPIATHYGRKVVVEAIVCGKFAVNSQGATFTVKRGGAKYNITHLATGYTCGTCFGLANAQALAHALDALPNGDFDTQDFALPFSERYTAWLVHAKPLIYSAEIGELRAALAGVGVGT